MIFRLVGGLPPIPQYEKPYIYVYIYNVYIYYPYAHTKELCQKVTIYYKEAPCTSYTSSAKVAILYLQDLCTFCVPDIYGVYIYIFACLFSVRNTINLSHHV